MNAPDGYEILSRDFKDTTRSGDLAWNTNKKTWEPVDSVNEWVDTYHAVARRKPAEVPIQDLVTQRVELKQRIERVARESKFNELVVERCFTIVTPNQAEAIINVAVSNPGLDPVELCKKAAAGSYSLESNKSAVEARKSPYMGREGYLKRKYLTFLFVMLQDVTSSINRCAIDMLLFGLTNDEDSQGPTDTTSYEIFESAVTKFNAILRLINEAGPGLDCYNEELIVLMREHIIQAYQRSAGSRGLLNLPVWVEGERIPLANQ
jgi:hypothetical protein